MKVLIIYIIFSTIFIAMSCEREKTIDKLIASKAISDAKLEHERIFNARRLRRLTSSERPSSVDLDAVALCFHILGTPNSISASILFIENGPIDTESGSLDKTDFFTQFEGVQRSALEGSRTINRMAWNWLIQNPKEMRKMLTEHSYSYTYMNPAQQRQWVENFMVANDKFSKDITWANRGVEQPLRLTRPTPTPVYSFADFPRKATPKPKKSVGRKTQ